jgi:thiosulfate dehydrogenase
MTVPREGARAGFGTAVTVCIAIGLALVAVTLYLGNAGTRAAGNAAPPFATEEYGRRLLRETPELLGRDHPDPERRFINSRLACASCHLNIGVEPGTLTLLQTDEHYPRFSGRAGTMTDIEDRINECMTRSMNGRALAMDSPEMIAMASYLRSLGAQYAAMGASARVSNEPAGFKTPDRRADAEAGRAVYKERCSICHGGMARVLTASRFIKARMPLGQPDLTDDQAFDVAAFIDSQPRPAMDNLEIDYPDRSLKPIDNGYGPYADSFPQDQHKYGPFKPIDDYYKSLKKPS